MNKLLTISGVFINAFNPSYKWARGEGGSDKWGGRCLVSRITARHKLRSRKTVIPYQRVGKTEKSCWIYHRCLLTRLNRACSSTRGTHYELSLKSKQWIRISLGTKETFGTLNSKNKLPKSREKNEEIIPRIFLKHPDDVAFRLWTCNKYWPTFIGKYLNLRGRNFWKSFWKFSNETLFENFWKN